MASNTYKVIEPVERGEVRKVSTAVFLNYLVANLGYYTLLPTLPLLFAEARHSSAWFVGTALFTLAFSVRVACLLLGGILRTLTIRAATAGGLLIPAIGFGLLAVASGPVPTLVCLALAGTGISVNTLMARTYIALALPSAAARNTAFSAVQVAVNVAAAVGPIAANLLFSSDRHGLTVLVPAALYAIGAVAVAFAVPAGVRAGDNDERKATVLGAIRSIVTEPQVRTVMAITVAGWFLYGQLFSALTLHISSITTSPLLRSSFFTANAVLVVLVQIPVSAHANRRLDTGMPPTRFLLIGVGIFAAAFASMAGLGALIAGCFVAVVVFSIAETFFTPFVSTAFAEISGSRPVIEAFVLLQIAMAVGEPLGSFSGGTLFTALSRHGLEPLYWAMLAAVAMLVVVACARRGRVATSVPTAR
ncbi:MFS transporter [Micromonospora sp. NPDC049559]|uniref:MFS transporter n=1 Tax=Micromonospora sp. NPDC049559 TaxID=3155923 RepID=UPI0034319E49